MPAETLGCHLFTCYSVVAPGNDHQLKRAAAYIIRFFLASNADNILGTVFLPVSGKSYLNLSNATAYLRVMEEGAEAASRTTMMKH